MKKKGFTLLELLAVIIILAVIALISTPVVLNVIEDAKSKAYLNSAYGLVNSAKLYYAESLFDSNKMQDIENNDNIFSKIVIQGEKPQDGYLYIDKNGTIALAVMYGKKCYKKGYADEKIIPVKTEVCDLSYVGDDSDLPEVKYTVIGTPFNAAGWSKENFFVKISVSDKTSGVANYKWCVSTEKCEPKAEVKGGLVNVSIITESATNQICVIAKDNKGNITENICSELYKLDKTAPVAGTVNITATMGSNNWYTSNVAITANDGSDILSGHLSTTPDVNIITTNTLNQVITVTTTDVAGNTSISTSNIKIDKDEPILTAKSDIVEIKEGDNNLSSTYFNAPKYSISGTGTLSCNPVNTSGLAVGQQTLTCTATGLNGLSNSVTKSITIKPSCADCLTNILKSQYKDTNTVGLLKEGDNYYYKGTDSEVAKNFVWYEGHLWRVITVNSDNTVTMVTQQPITSISSASSVWTTGQQYKDSYINTWLNNVFYNSISDKSKIQQSTYNVGIYYNVSEITTTQYVGLLDEAQYTRAGLANSFLDIKDYFWLGNRYNSTRMRSVNYSGNLNDNSPTSVNGSRPVIKISDLTITNGNGTLSDPFRETKTSTNTSNVKVGEYVSVPGSSTYCSRVTSGRCLFRVISKDSDSVKVILNGLLPTTSIFGSTPTFSTSSTIYGKLTGFANSISANYRYVGNKTFNIGMYPSVSGTEWDYNLVKNQTIASNVGLSVVGEMFSGNDIDVRTQVFVNIATIENRNASNEFWIMNARTINNSQVVYQNGNFSYVQATIAKGVRPVIFLNSGTTTDLTFTKGEGTAENPYWLGN